MYSQQIKLQQKKLFGSSSEKTVLPDQISLFDEIEYTSYAGKTMKIWAAEVADLPGERAPGKIHVTKDRLFVETGEGVLDVKELQLEGKKRMDTASFLRGFQMEDGSFCG